MKILICDKLDDNAIKRIKDAVPEVTYKTEMSPEELIETIPDYDAMVVRSATKVTQSVIKAGKNLKLIVRAGVGLDNVDVEFAHEKKIEVKNTPGVTTVSVAEHTIGLMIALARYIPQADAGLKNGRWDRKKYSGTELMGKTLGIVGLGRIGKEVSIRAEVFGMNILASDPHKSTAFGKEHHISLTALDELLSASDYVSLHLPLKPETKNMFDKATLSKMKKGSFFINTARGGIVDERALADLISNGHIAGAAFDVFEKEPPEADNPLLKLDQVILAPHLGASTTEGQLKAGAEVAEIIINFCKS